MQNRDSEFRLVFDNGPLGNELVSATIFELVVGAIREVIQVGYDLHQSPEPPGIIAIDIYQVTPPERGSISLSLLAGGAVIGIGIAANISQLSGITLKDIFKGVTKALSPQNKPQDDPDPNVRRMVRDEEFKNAVRALADVADGTDFASIKLVFDNDIAIELKGSPTSTFEEIDASDFAAELDRLAAGIIGESQTISRIKVPEGTHPNPERRARAMGQRLQEAEERRRNLRRLARDLTARPNRGKPRNQ